LLMSVFLVLCIELERLYRKVLERNLSREGVFRFVRRALVANKQCNAQVNSSELFLQIEIQKLCVEKIGFGI
jgi:hypothetical protein